MSKIELYQTAPAVKELPARQTDIEKRLQTLIEENMETFFGVRFLATEYTTSNGGRIDSLGLDENNLPTIFEYKRSISENVINQGLFYLDWLLDHKADFRELARDKLGSAAAKEIDSSSPRLICIAAEFTRYDSYAVNQIDKNIDLIRYRLFDNDLILFEQVHSNTSAEKKNSVSGTPITSRTPKTAPSSSSSKISNNHKTFAERKAVMDPEIHTLLEAAADYIRSLGDDITEQEKKHYLAFKKIKNFACIRVTNKEVTLYLKLNPDEHLLEAGFTRDVQNIGHQGTGDLEVLISDWPSFEKAKPLIQESYRRG